MTGPKRTNKLVMVKTFRLDPELVNDMEKVIYLARKEGDRAKYRSMTQFVVKAFTNLVNKERRGLEEAGVAWDHININKQPKE